MKNDSADLFGSPLLPARMWRHVERLPDSGCWSWVGARSRHGYGSAFFEGRTVTAHRFFYMALVGDIPDGLVIDHLCRYKSCVNPGHLEPVTQAVNLVRAGLNGSSTSTHCLRGHAFDEQNTQILKRGSRRCRTCQTAHNRASYQRAKDRAQAA